MKNQTIFWRIRLTLLRRSSLSVSAHAVGTRVESADAVRSAFRWCFGSWLLTEYWYFWGTGLLDGERYWTATRDGNGRWDFWRRLSRLLEVLTNLLDLRHSLLWLSLVLVVVQAYRGVLVNWRRKLDFIVLWNKVLLDMSSLLLQEVRRRQRNIRQSHRRGGGHDIGRCRFRWSIRHRRWGESRRFLRSRHVFNRRVVAFEDNLGEELAHLLTAKHFLSVITAAARAADDCGLRHVVVDLRIARVAIHFSIHLHLFVDLNFSFDDLRLEVALGLVFLQIVEHLHVEIQLDIVDELNRRWLRIGGNRHDIILHEVIVCN